MGYLYTHRELVGPVSQMGTVYQWCGMADRATGKPRRAFRIPQK